MNLRSILLASCAGFPLAGPAIAADTATPIKHLIVVFQENVSFDHYFATYPHALNPPGEPSFTPAPGTPSVNGLTPALLEHNPNLANPFRLGPKQAATCDMDHAYDAEQKAFDHGLMDKFVEYTRAPSADKCPKEGVMGYFDGNTVTALWNYAQHFAMSDNFFGTSFGPSTPGALNLVAGTTHGAVPPDLIYREEVKPAAGTSKSAAPPAVREEVLAVSGTAIGDPDPQFDDCSNPKYGLLAMTGRNVGDLLNAKGVTWGWFQGGFRRTEVKDGKAACNAASVNITGAKVIDYSPHHEPFQYYSQTANPHHLPPSSPDKVGLSDQANHQYDLADFTEALNAGRLPEVSFVKAKKYQDGHAGQAYSNPIDEQKFLAEFVNGIAASPYWKDTAIIITYDDSDGWYDHAMPPILNGSALADLDWLNCPGLCGKATADGYPGRCGYGPRLPFLIVSPYARVNFVDHSLTDQSSILRFIEDNWSLGRIGDQSMDALAGSLENMFDFEHPAAQPVKLDPATGQVVQ